MGVHAMVLMAAGQAVGGAMSAAGQWQRADAEHQLAQEQARFSRMQMGHARDVGAFQEQQLRMQVGQMRGAQDVAFGMAGVDPRAGTPGLLRREMQVMSEMDVSMLRSNVARQVWGLGVQTEMDLMGADMRRKTQRQQAGMTFLGGLTQAGTTWYGGM